jgi:hypothetical protein
MQNGPFSPFGSSPSAFEDAFQRAHAHTCPAAALWGSASSVGDTPGFDVADGNAAAGAERMLGGAELLHVVREPVEWLLTLAHRLAAGDPDDVAAVDRLRATFHARLAGRPVGVRRSDALTAFGLLVGALDPSVVLQAVTKTIADGVATMLACEGAALAAHLTGLADVVPAVAVHRACGSRPQRGQTSRAHYTP